MADPVTILNRKAGHRCRSQKHRQNHCNSSSICPKPFQAKSKEGQKEDEAHGSRQQPKVEALCGLALFIGG